MSKNGSQFIINLVKLPNGYAFQSCQEVENASLKKKSAGKDKNKNNQKKPHRIFRELAITQRQAVDLVMPIPEEPEPAPRQVQPEVEEDYSVQIRRENGLPESPAKWYDESSIHQIEKQSMPEFFNGRSYKTPNLYLKFRNFIVALYRKNPYEYLTKIACRRILRGDVNAIMKIHSFLQREGVINFCVSKDGNYTFSTSLFNRAINPESKSRIAVDKLEENEQERETEPIDMTNITVTTVNKCFSKSNRVFCSKCESICGILWYRKKDQTDKSTVLCIQCHQLLSEEEMEQYVKTDIVKKIQTGAQDNKAAWSIDDNLKLLQFVSKPTDNWQSLEGSFEKKKTFDDIMLQFMQFPIGNFEPQKSAPKLEPAIEDPPEHHASKLIERFKNSAYNKNQEPQRQQESLDNEQFTKSMVKMTKKLCQKFESTMKTSLKIENEIERALFELQTLKTVSNKRIQNQEAPISEESKNFKNEFEGHSPSNEQEEEQFNENENEIENEPQPEERGEGEGEQSQDFMDNLQYN